MVRGYTQFSCAKRRVNEWWLRVLELLLVCWLLGSVATDAEDLFSGSMNAFTSMVVVLRWTSANNLYRACINGTNLIRQKSRYCPERSGSTGSFLTRCFVVFKQHGETITKPRSAPSPSCWMSSPSDCCRVTNPTAKKAMLLCQAIIERQDDTHLSLSTSTLFEISSTFQRTKLQSSDVPLGQAHLESRVSYRQTVQKTAG